MAAAFAAAAILLALFAGSHALSISDVWHALTGEGQGIAGDVVLQLRLPRALAGFATGGLLALAGALMQVLLRNPLADPYVLGLSGGAASGALVAMLAGLGALLIGAMALAGAAASIALVLALARRDFSRRPLLGAAEASPRLLLTGATLATGWGALIILILTLAPDPRLRGMLFWLMGDLNGVEHYVPALAGWGVALALVYPMARDLNAMTRGEAVAHALGVAVRRTRAAIYLLASGATAVAVTTAGTIGFIGLIVPHALRLAIGNDQRVLLPACALTGGAVLVLADTLARSVVAPLQLPVGVVTAVLGVPAFLYLLLARGPRP